MIERETACADMQREPKITEVLQSELDVLGDILTTIGSLEFTITGNERVTEQKKAPENMRENIQYIHDRNLEIRERLYVLRELF